MTINTTTSGDTVLGLFNQGGTLLQSNDDNGNPGELASLITASLGAGTYSISVSKYAFLPENGGIFSNVNSISSSDLSYTLGVSVA